MQARRTLDHGAEAGWSSVAVHLQSAGSGKEGFYLTLFPDGRPPAVVFLRPSQLEDLLDLAAQAQVGDQQIWDLVAKIPMEPLLPSRSLYPRLRALLVDCSAAIRAQIRAQKERALAPPPLAEERFASPAAPWAGGGEDPNGSGLP